MPACGAHFQFAEYTSKDYHKSEKMNFSKGDALFQPPNLSALFQNYYDQQCETLCYGSYPSWKDVLSSFQDIRYFL